MIGIYKITSPTNRIYIGQSINIKKRFNKYKNLDCKTQIRLYRSFIKYGFENHKIEVLIECYISELNNMERYYQELYNCVNNGLNCILTKTNEMKMKHSKESRIKISESQKGEKSAWWGKKHTEETKKKMRDWYKNNSNPMLGVVGKDCANSKTVLDFSTGIFYESAKDVSESLGFKYSTIRSILNGTNINKTSLKYV